MASSYVIIILLFLTFCQLVLQNEIPGDAGDFCAYCLIYRFKLINVSSISSEVVMILSVNSLAFSVQLSLAWR